MFVNLGKLFSWDKRTVRRKDRKKDIERAVDVVTSKTHYKKHKYINLTAMIDH